MAKNWKVPVETYRTPEQHRAIIQKPDPPSIRVKTSKRAKKVRWRKIPGFDTYADYLKSDAWKEVKAKWMKSGLCKGALCHSKGCGETAFLSLHHRTYKRIGKEKLDDLVLVCNKCHHRIHQIEKSGVKLQSATKQVVGY